MKKILFILIFLLFSVGFAYPQQTRLDMRGDRLKLDSLYNGLNYSKTVYTPYSSDLELLNWKYDSLPQARDYETFGHIVYDPDSSLWRMFVHTGVSGSTGNIAQYEGASPRGPWTNRQIALDHGATGSWDAKETGVPFIWYESGQIRPWRMMYRGARLVDGVTQVGFATSIDGKTWERKDIDGNSLLLSISNCANSGTGLIRITSNNHGFHTGQSVSIYGVVGTTEANGSFIITVIDDNSFDLESSTFANTYVSGGTISYPVLSVSGLKRSIGAFANNGSGKVRVTSTGHGYTTGTKVTIWNALTTTEANGNWTITVIDANNFDLNNSTFAHASTGNGYAGLTSSLVGNDNSKWTWDAAGFDFGGILKYGNTYYVHYNTTSSPRVIGLATSSDLKIWTKEISSPIFNAVSDFEDKTQNGTADVKAGFFCGDFIRWDKADGTLRFVAIIPHYKNVAGSSTLPSLDIFTSTTPDFAKANRTYIGKAFRTDGVPVTYYVEGTAVQSSGVDTPRTITDDITRNILTTTSTGNEKLIFAAIYNNIWNQVIFSYRPGLSGSTLTNIISDLPNENPVYSLSPVASDANVLALWLPSVTKTLREMSGYDYHLYGQHSGINNNGLKLTAANVEYARYKSSSATLTRLNTLTSNLTLEVKGITASAWASGRRTLIYYGQGAGALIKFALNVYPLGSGNYKLELEAALDGTNRTILSNTFAMAVDTPYQFAVCKSGVNVKFFINGVLNRDVDWYAGSFPTINTGWLLLGGYGVTPTQLWDGYIDEVRVSDNARYSATYTPTPITYALQSTGTIFTKVYDLGSQNKKSALMRLTSQSPIGTSLTRNARNATSGSNQSTNIADFVLYPSSTVNDQYQQFAIGFTGNGVNSPSVSNLSVFSVK